MEMYWQKPASGRGIVLVIDNPEADKMRQKLDIYDEVLYRLKDAVEILQRAIDTKKLHAEVYRPTMETFKDTITRAEAIEKEE